MERTVADLIRRGRSPLRNPCILAENFTVKGGELDLVVEAEGLSGTRRLYAIEVRARGQTMAGRLMVDPAETIGAKKQQRIRRTLKVFLAQYSGPATEVALILASITRSPQGAHVEFREF